MSVSRVVTPEKIEAAVKRLVEVAHPSRIILFGSAARGELDRYSDVDLLVVLPDEPVLNDGTAVIRLYSALADIPMSKDIIVVSEERLAELGDRPSLVYREALRTGKGVYEDPDMIPPRRGRWTLQPSVAGLPHTWLAHARSDLVVARLARSNSDVLPEQACFHAQQAVEKAVKAALLARNVDFPYTHNLEELVNELTSRGLAVPIDLTSAKELTRYAALTRCPHSESISESQVDQAIEIAEAVVAWAIPLVPTPRGAT